MKQKGRSRKDIADFVKKTVAKHLTFVNHLSPKRDGRVVPDAQLRTMKDHFNSWRDKGEMVDAKYSAAVWAWENRMGQCNESASTAFHILAMALESTNELALLRRGDHLFLVWGDVGKIPSTFSGWDLLRLSDTYVIDAWDNKSFSTKWLSYLDLQWGRGDKIASLPYKVYLRQYETWLAGCRANPDAHRKWLYGKAWRSGSTGNRQNIKLFNAIKETESSKTKAFPRLQINTSQWWSQAYKMRDSKTISNQAKKRGLKMYLAGTQDGKQGWGIDNFLLIEISLGNGTVKHFVVGSVEAVTYQGKQVKHLGANRFKFGPKEIELAQHIPDGSRFTLTITPLDYGGKKFLTDVWLVFEYTSG